MDYEQAHDAVVKAVQQAMVGQPASVPSATQPAMQLQGAAMYMPAPGAGLGQPMVLSQQLGGAPLPHMGGQAGFMGGMAAPGAMPMQMQMMQGGMPGYQMPPQMQGAPGMGLPPHMQPRMY